MAYARIAVYLVGLAILVAAVWVFLTQTEIGQQVPAGLALALILLIVGVGIMASARGIRESREVRRVAYDTPGAYPPGGYYGERYADTPGSTLREGTIVEDRRRYE